MTTPDPEFTLHHQPSLRQIADRLMAIAQTLVQAPAYDQLESTVVSLDLCRDQLENWLDYALAQLRQNDGLDRLRPDAQGHYAWDRWQAEALAAGLGSELVSLGRALMREAVQHDWDEDLKAECGWSDGGRALLALALRDGEAAAERWTYLLETDGERGRWTEDGDWVPL